MLRSYNFPHYTQEEEFRLIGLILFFNGTERYFYNFAEPHDPEHHHMVGCAVNEHEKTFEVNLANGTILEGTFTHHMWMIGPEVKEDAISNRTEPTPLQRGDDESSTNTNDICRAPAGALQISSSNWEMKTPSLLNSSRRLTAHPPRVKRSK